MTDESVIEAKKPDGFTHESPIRAFTDFRQDGMYAIGKGFRPSLAHLSTYLNAMHQKEGWETIQFILPRDSDGDPTIVFRKSLPTMVMIEQLAGPPDPAFEARIKEFLGESKIDQHLRMRGRSAQPHDHLPEMLRKLPEGDKDKLREILRPDDRPTFVPDITDHTFVGGDAAKPRPHLDDKWFEQAHRAFAPVAADDPVNPKHYKGKACAEIIEYMPFNVGVAGKYLWRLGEKDSHEVEVGKLTWYLEREIDLHSQEIAPRPVFGLASLVGDAGWYQSMAFERIEASGMPDWRKSAMRCLVYYTLSGQLTHLRAVTDMAKCSITTGCDMGRGLEP